MYIYTLAIDNAGPYAIKPRTTCKRIEARENYNSANAATADFNQFDETDSAGARGGRVAKGTSAIFTRATPFSPTDIAAGYMNTASGSITLLVIEHDTI